MMGQAWGVWWGLGLQRPAPATLPPAQQVERVGGVVVTKRDRRTLRPELVLSAGPVRLGQPGGGTFAELYGAAWSLAVYRSGPQLFQARAGVWTEQSDPAALAGLTGAQHVALAFDQAARPVLSWELDEQIYIRQWVPGTGYVTRGPWAGRDPVLSTDALVNVPVSQSDVHLWHLDGGAVVARVQRELYAVPHQVATAEPGALLDQALPDRYRLALLGARADGTPLVLTSTRYPVPVQSRARATLSGPTGAALLPVLLTLAMPRHDAAATLSGPTGAARVSVLTTLSLTRQDAAATLSGPTGALREQPGVWLPPLRTTDVAATLSGPTGAGLRLALYTVSLSQHGVIATLSGPTGANYDPA